MNPFIKAIQQQFPDGVRGTSRQLLEHLGKRPAGLEAKNWPGNAYWASRIIKTHKAQLEAAGWTIEIEPSTTKGKRAATWHLVPPAKEEPEVLITRSDHAPAPAEPASALTYLERVAEALEQLEKASHERHRVIYDRLDDRREDSGERHSAVLGVLEGISRGQLDQMMKLLHEINDKRLEAMGERMDKLAALGEQLFEWFEKENKLRWGRVEKLGDELEEAQRELDRLSRPWWKRRGKK